jgi:hypothetical protein
MSLTYYCVYCREEVLKQSFEQHREKHLENPFINYPKTLEELEKQYENFKASGRLVCSLQDTY